jgi:hypothetical protein
MRILGKELVRAFQVQVVGGKANIHAVSPATE